MAQSNAASRGKPGSGSSAKKRASSSSRGSRPAARSGSSGNRGSGATSQRSSASRRSSASARRKPASSARPRSSSGRSSDGGGRLDSVKDALGSGVQSTGDALGSAGSSLGTAAQKAKGPALAGGAALAGLAGGLVLASRGGGPRRVMGVAIPGTRKPLLKIKGPAVTIKNPRAKGASKDLLRAAGEIGSAGRQVGELVTEVQRVRGELNHGRRRSPVEVVLQGLTSRRR
jgi:hypothetical protein